MPHRFVRLVPVALTLQAAVESVTRSRHTAVHYSIDGNGCIDLLVRDVRNVDVPGCIALGLVGITSDRPTPRDSDWPQLVERGHGVVRFFDLDLGIWLHHDPTSSTAWRNTNTLAQA